MDLGPIFPFTSGPSQQIDDLVACDYCDQATPKRDSRERCRNCGARKPDPKPLPLPPHPPIEITIIRK